jgi:hypothetical protein
MGLDFKSFEGHERGPVVHHKDGLPLMVGGERRVDGVVVHIGRDGDYLHVQAFDGRHLGLSLQPGAPLSALVEKIRNDDADAAADRLAQRAVRYAQKKRYWDGPIKYPESGIF